MMCVRSPPGPRKKPDHWNSAGLVAFSERFQIRIKSLQPGRALFAIVRLRLETAGLNRRQTTPDGRQSDNQTCYGSLSAPAGKSRWPRSLSGIRL